jgi:hypothetical protein
MNREHSSMTEDFGALSVEAAPINMPSDWQWRRTAQCGGIVGIEG